MYFSKNLVNLHKQIKPLQNIKYVHEKVSEDFCYRLVTAGWQRNGVSELLGNNCLLDTMGLLRNSYESNYVEDSVLYTIYPEEMDSTWTHEVACESVYDDKYTPCGEGGFHLENGVYTTGAYEGEVHYRSVSPKIKIPRLGERDIYINNKRRHETYGWYCAKIYFTLHSENEYDKVLVSPYYLMEPYFIFTVELQKR